MRRDVVYRGWIFFACAFSIISGAALWVTGERVMGGCGLATALLHLVWMIDVCRCTRACVRRRAIVIPQLRPMVVSPPRQHLVQRLRAWWRPHG